MLVDHGRRAREQPDAAFPMQPAAAVGADMSCPFAVVDLRAARRGRQRGPPGAARGSSPKSLITIRPLSADLEQQPPGRALRSVIARRAAQQAGFGTEATAWTPSSRLVALSASVLPEPAAPTRSARWGRTLDAIRGDGGAGHLDDAGVGEVEPAAERLEHLADRARVSVYSGWPSTVPERGR